MTRRGSRRLRSALRALALPTLALAAVLAFLPGRTTLALRLYALVLAGLACIVVLGTLRRRLPPPRALPIRPPEPAPRTTPASLARLEDELALALGSAFDYHRRLEPRLRVLAEELLALRRGISWNRDPEAARVALGEEAWTLLTGAPPTDRHARGPTLQALEEGVTILERL